MGMALKYYRKTLCIEQATDNCERRIAQTLGHIAIIHEGRGELDEAIKCFSETIEILKKASKQDNGAVARTLNRLGNLYLQLGQTRNMIDALSDSIRCFHLDGIRGDTVHVSGFEFYSLSKMH